MQRGAKSMKSGKKMDTRWVMNRIRELEKKISKFENEPLDDKKRKMLDELEMLYYEVD